MLRQSPRREAYSLPAGRQPITDCPEIDCIRHRLPVGVIAVAERRAREIGVGAERVLIAARLISEDAYVSALARSLGVPFEPLDDAPRAACPLDDVRLIEAAAAGMLPIRFGNEVAIVVAPRQRAARRLAVLGRSGDLPYRIRLTSADRLQQFVDRNSAHAIGRKATDGLKVARPDFSAAHGDARSQIFWTVALAALAAAAFVAPMMMYSVVSVALSVVFFAWIALRIMGMLTAAAPKFSSFRLAADWLPVYTIIVALYREAGVVERLVAALDALDYPVLGSNLTLRPLA